MNVLTRQAERNDGATIIEFNAAMALETEGKNLDRITLKSGVERLFDQAHFGCYYLAESAGAVIGQLMVTYEWSDWRNGVFWWIQSVYVRPEFRGKGVYRTMYEAVLAKARSAKDVCGIRLYVDKSNLPAKKVYHICGMVEAHYDLFEVDFVLGEKHIIRTEI